MMLDSYLYRESELVTVDAGGVSSVEIYKKRCFTYFLRNTVAILLISRERGQLMVCLHQHRRTCMK